MKNPYQNVFKLIETEFKAQAIPCVLIGGIALSKHGYDRFTKDVDFMISDEFKDKAIPLLQSLGYKVSQSTDSFCRFKSDHDNLVDLDLVYVDHATLSAIREHGKEVTHDGHRFIVPSLNHLLALKLHAIKNNPKGREMKDLLDIVELVRINDIDVNGAEFKSLCEKYGTQDTYRKIHNVVGEK